MIVWISEGSWGWELRSRCAAFLTKIDSGRLMDRQECSSELIKRLELVVVGASSGGLETLIEFLQALPEQYQVPTVVVLHQRANRVSGVPEMLSKYTHLKVVEPEDKQKIIEERQRLLRESRERDRQRIELEKQREVLERRYEAEQNKIKSTKYKY